MSRTFHRLVDICVWFLLLLELVTCLSAIAMLSRQGAALRVVADRAIADSGQLEVALLATARLLDPSMGDPPPDLPRLLSSLRATKPPSTELTNALVSETAGLMARDRGAIERSVRVLTKLTEENRKQHQLTARSLSFQSRAASWALVFFGVAGMLLAAFFRHLLQRNLVAPTLELARVLNARVRGDAAIRLGEGRATRPWLALNQVLSAMATLELREQDNQAHRALVAWLDRYPEPAALLGENRKLVALNRPCLTLLAGPDGEVWRRLMAEGRPSEQLSLESWNQEFSLCRLPVQSSQLTPATEAVNSTSQT